MPLWSERYEELDLGVEEVDSQKLRFERNKGFVTHSHIALQRTSSLYVSMNEPPRQFYYLQIFYKKHNNLLLLQELQVPLSI